jgi:chromatin segregation and condensation protein Rec8/ScpA/Scc1 (kleisin family)
VSSAPSISKLAKLTSSPNDRLDEASTKIVLEIVLENLIKHNMICVMDIDMVKVAETYLALCARELWNQMLQRTLIERIINEVVKRKLFPVTIHTLCALLIDEMKSFL